MKTKTKGKAIIGIAMAAIIGAVILAAVPTVSAQSLDYSYYNNLTHNISLNDTGLTLKPAAVSVLIGQELHLWASNNASNATVLIEGDPTSEAIRSEIFTVTTGKFKTVAITKPGVYYCNKSGGTPTTEPTRWDAKLAVTNPLMTLGLKSGGSSVSSITAGTNLTIDFTNNLDGSDMVSLVITDPDGNTLKRTTASTLTPKTQLFDKINVTNLTTRFGGITAATSIDTTGWKLGTYKFKVATKENVTADLGAQGLIAESNEATLTMLKSEISISASTTSAAELESVTLTVTGVKDHSITINSADWAHTTFPGGSNDNPSTVTSADFTTTIDADGTRTFVVFFNETGSYTMKVTDNTAAGTPTDTVDITVSEKAVTFDVPTTVIIGEKLTIKGTSNTGDFVTVAVEDTTYDVLERLEIDGNGEFSKEINTLTACGSKFAVPGSVRLKAYIDPIADQADATAVPAAWPTDDGTTVVLMSRGGLTAELSTTAVAQEDDFTISGVAKGARNIDILIVPPKGSGGSLIESGATALHATAAGIYWGTTSVSETDDTYSKKVTVVSTADTGKYLVIVLSKGSDDVYGKAGHASLTEVANNYTLSAKTQEQILIIMEDGTYGSAGSDDLYWVGYVKVEAATVTLDPVASVGIGEPLVVSGTTNRKEGFTIVVTCKGPMELTPQTVTVENGVFNATFDTTDATVGTYTVKADDGDGHTDEVTAEILTAVPPTPTPVVEVTATPEVTPTIPVAEATPTPEPTPTPTPTPGFEAVFAIAGLLAVAYLVQRKRRE